MNKVIVGVFLLSLHLLAESLGYMEVGQGYFGAGIDQRERTDKKSYNFIGGHYGRIKENKEEAELIRVWYKTVGIDRPYIATGGSLEFVYSKLKNMGSVSGIGFSLIGAFTLPNVENFQIVVDGLVVPALLDKPDEIKINAIFEGGVKGVASFGDNFLLSLGWKYQDLGFMDSRSTLFVGLGRVF